jgi:hypothetical protein
MWRRRVKQTAAGAGAGEIQNGGARACIERRGELPKDDEENPLDDQEKLDAIRLRVFGSVPE